MRPLEILLVDDDPVIVEAIQTKLAELGHSVTCAENGAQAIEHVGRKVFDVVVTDVLMPVLDGLQVIGELRRSQPNVRVVAVSGGGRTGYNHYLDAARMLGAHAVLAKPFSFSELDAVLRPAGEST